MSAGGSQFLWVDGFLEWLIGCRPMSPGCKNCPACEALARLGHPRGHVWHSTMAEWAKICKIKPHSLILACASSDMFIEEAEVWWADMHAQILSRPDVTFVVLTKRLANAKKFFERFGAPANLWLGTSAEDQKTLDERVPLLYSILTAGYILSLQPLIAEVDVTPYLSEKKLQKVITGCELGENARPCEGAWLDKIKAACKAHGVRCFVARYRDKKGHIVRNITENGRRGPAPWYNLRTDVPTIGEQMGIYKRLVVA